jgi:NAD(P)-dependent dehydrogenase (short-subunit alcohol dehydrogenase family)
MRATRAVLAPMLRQGGGAIVNVASVNAFFEPDGGTIDYGAAKAALLNFSKAVAQEFGPRGIRINCVSPGPVATIAVTRSIVGSSRAQRRAYPPTIPLAPTITSRVPALGVDTQLAGR